MKEHDISGWEEFISGKLDAIPIELTPYEDWVLDMSDDPDFDFSKKLGITDNIYLDTGINLRWLKHFQP